MKTSNLSYFQRQERRACQKRAAAIRHTMKRTWQEIETTNEPIEVLALVAQYNSMKTRLQLTTGMVAN